MNNYNYTKDDTNTMNDTNTSIKSIQETDIFFANPCVLFSNLTILPDNSMNTNQQFNAMARFIILLTGIFYLNNMNWKPVLLVGLGGLIVMYMIHKSMNKNQQTHHKENFTFPKEDTSCLPCQNRFAQTPNLDKINQMYEIKLPIQFNHDDAAKRSYANAKYELIPLEDTNGFRQIWRKEPEDCGYYSMPVIKQPYELIDNQQEDHTQCNYIHRVNVNLDAFGDGQQGALATRALAEQQFRDDTNLYRNLIGEYADRFNRERKHNCMDMKLSAAPAGSGTIV